MLSDTSLLASECVCTKRKTLDKFTLVVNRIYETLFIEMECLGSILEDGMLFNIKNK